jgi:hypothetical protein
MRSLYALVVLGLLAGPASAQQRDTTRRAPRDSAAIADSIARADSIALVRELERIAGERRPVSPAPAGAVQRQQSRLLPDISLLGDLIADASPDGSTQEDETRFGIRELELGLQAAVDPYFRADAFFGISDLEGIAIEEAYLSTLALPHGLQVRAGRVHLPIGKQNTTHRPELHTIEYPYVIQRFLGPEGGKGTGLWVSKLFAPFGFYQELQLVVMDRFGGETHGPGEEEEEEGGGAELHAEPDEPPNERLSGLGYAARFRNYWDLSEATNIELSVSGATGKATQGVFCVPTGGGDEVPCAGLPTGVNARTGVVGTDFTFRWRPLQEGLYRSFIFQAEWMRQLNDDTPPLSDAPAGFELEYEGATRSFDGLYAFARYQLSRRSYVGARYDWLEDAELNGTRLTAASGYLTFFPSEFSKLVAGYERVMPSGGLEATNRLILQATFALGPHRPHPF